MATEKRVILLAHGAWNPSAAFDPLKDALKAHGYELLVPELATLGRGKSGLSWDADVAILHEAAAPIFDQGKHVVMLGHSYGGIPACNAVRNNSVEERRVIGKRGGFSQLIILCGFALPACGMTALSASGGSWAPWQEVIELENGGKQLFVNEKAKDVLFNDFSPDNAQATFDSLLPCSYDAFITGTEFSIPDVTIPKTFIICEDDLVFPPEFQRALVAASGPELKQVSINGGHSAFGSVPDEVAKALINIIEGKSVKE